MCIVAAILGFKSLMSNLMSISIDALSSGVIVVSWCSVQVWRVYFFLNRLRRESKG